MKKILIFFTLTLLIMYSTAYSQSNNKIKWYSFEEAVKLNAITPKKVFIDIYTDWCGWCKFLDQNTFSDTTIIRLMNKYFYAVKLNAERKDTVVFSGYSFINPNPKVSRSTHQLASSMLKGRMSYPSMVFMDDSMHIITTIQSYMKPPELEPLLAFFGQNLYQKTTYETFKPTYNPISAGVVADLTPKPFILNKVIFDAGKSDITANASTQLDSMVAVLKGNTNTKIEVYGYTDNTGDATMNKTLSEKRAKAVCDYFINKGIDYTRLAYAGYGSQNPIAENNTAAGQKLNRRIEIKIINK